jgi:hypothetical protein
VEKRYNKEEVKSGKEDDMQIIVEGESMIEKESNSGDKDRK